MKNNLSKLFIQVLCILTLAWSASCIGLSDTYFYELYLHNEYYSDPAGFPSKFVITPLVASYKSKGPQWCEDRFTVGVIEALRLTHDHAWIEFIAAFGEEKVRFDHQGHRGQESRFGGDDFLIDFGYNFLLDEKGKIQILLHWLTGIPTRWKVTRAELEEPLFGTRTVATGPVIEFAYDFIRNSLRDVFIGLMGRFLHRFKRSYQPILPPNALFNPGEAIDLLALIHYRYDGHNFEFGYVPTFRFNSSYQFPNRIEHLPSQQLNSIYFDYFYYSNKLSMSFETNIAKTFGKTEGIAWYALIGWYF